MKTLLAILLSFIMADAPVLFARDEYSLGSPTSLIGTYAGVLIPVSDNLLVPTATDFGANSLGLFTLSLPNEGLGSGSIVLFSNGRTFSGSIQALPDPSNPSGTGVIGVVNAAFNYTLSTTDTAGDVTSTNVTANAQGSFDASVTNNSISVGGLGVDLSGTSLIDVDQGFVSGSNGTPIVTEQITFAVDGFKQSLEASSTSTTGT